MQKGALIANGNTAEVYEWGERHVLKLFRPQFEGNAEYEASLARLIQIDNVPAPVVSEIVQVDGRAGIVYTRVDGQTMTAYWLESPLWRLFPLARQLAHLHHAIHTAPVRHVLPRQRQRLREKIRRAVGLGETTRQRVLARLDTLPDGNALCHGDFHPENILFSPQGAVVIDWIDTTAGSPLADVARTYILMEMSARCQPFSLKKLVESLAIQLFLFEYLRVYCRLSHVHPADVRAWLPVVAAARLDENVGDQEALLVAFVEANL
jgi:Ser/Thr protein kinase RdoA (MazF antagonist)